MIVNDTYIEVTGPSGSWDPEGRTRRVLLRHLYGDKRFAWREVAAPVAALRVQGDPAVGEPRAILKVDNCEVLTHELLDTEGVPWMSRLARRPNP